MYFKKDYKPELSSNNNCETHINEVELDRRDFIGMIGLAGVALWGLVPMYSEAGTTNVNLSGSASGFASGLPVSDPIIWYNPSNLSSYSNGSSITTWLNSGSFGANYDLHNPTNFLSSNSAGSGTVVAPLKATYLGFPCAQFTWNGTAADPSKGWAFRSQLGSPTVATNYWYINGNSSNGKAPNPITFFSVYYSSQASYGHWGNYVSASYIPTGIDGGYNISSTYVNAAAFTLLDKSDIIAGSGTGTDQTNVITSFGYRYNPSGNVGSFFQNKTPAIINITPSNPSSFCLAPWGIGMARTIPNIGYLFEQVAFNRTLSDNEVTTMRNYFAAKYGGATNT